MAQPRPHLGILCHWEKKSPSLKLLDDSGLLGCSGVSSGEWFPTFRKNLFRETKTRIPVGARYFPLLKDAHNGCWAHVVSCAVGNGGSFPGVKQKQREVYRSHSFRMSGAIPLLLLYAFMTCKGTATPINVSERGSATRKLLKISYKISNPAAYEFTLKSI